MSAQKTLIGIGNAAIDAMIELSSESDIQKYNLEKGGCVFVGNDDPVMTQMLSDYPDHFLDAGGAAANAICAYAALGGQTRLIAKTGQDAHGDFFIRETTKFGVVHETDPTTLSPSTFLIAAITPDRERSFLSNHGASHNISANDVEEKWFTPNTSLIIDGYMLMSGGGPEAMFQAMDYAEHHGSEIIFMPCSLSVIDNNRDLIDQIITRAHSLICNEDEAVRIYGDDYQTAIQSDFDWGVVTLGEKGLWFFDKDGDGFQSPPYAPPHIENTNGAGDNFSGGLLYGLHHWMSLKDACLLGQKCAIHVLGRKSARCDESVRSLLS
jgi:sugar/nucleoside kinase (ribokinase family)